MAVWLWQWNQNPFIPMQASRRVKTVADDVGMLFGACQSIFTDVLGMKRAASKILSKFLNFEQKQRCLNIAQEMLSTFNDDPDLLKKVITGDQSWLYGYDNETKTQSSQWKRPEESRLLLMMFKCRSAHANQFLRMKRAASKIVPQFLYFEQKQRHMDNAHEMLLDVDNPDLLKKVITGDVSWLYG